jgi:membrane protease YdiL (CAAX protease family)
VPWDIWVIFFVLGVVVPWRGRARLRDLLAKPHVGTAERVSLYLSTVVFQWLAAGVAGWRAWARGFSAAQLGLATDGRWTMLVAGMAGAGIIATLQWLNLRRMGRPGTRKPQILQALAERILPQSRSELVPFLALAVTAGICEEFLYRGFAMAAFTRAGLPAWGVVLVSSALFGLAHLYQGRAGFFSTMILGALFAGVRIAYDSLVPVVLWHVAVDVVAGVAAPRYLVRQGAPGDELSTYESVT